MLKVVGQKYPRKAETEFGEYLPFSFWYHGTSDTPRIYWRTGDFEFSLLEVEIERATGQIIGSALILPAKASEDFPNLNFPHASNVAGCPIVDVNGWPDNSIKDEAGELRVFVDSTRLLIAFSALSSTTKKISGDNITFGIDADNCIVWILINNLAKEKLTTLVNLPS